MNGPGKPEEIIIEIALAMAPADRAAYVDNACAGNAELRGLVEAWLRAHQHAFSTTPPITSRPIAGTERVGERVGRYTLLEQIGEGGYGAVYRARQEEPVRREVALKVIKLGMDTRQVVARFESERQTLALMEHPNIAKVLDAGATDAGRPYFAMELIRGTKITSYCDQHNLPTEKRLDLFMQVCRAIHHAHQKGIIHRDLKPSNILVTLEEGVGVPKIIDFGIAKATHFEFLDKTQFTAFQQFIGTPAYMSPEQVSSNGSDIDIRSDIYSLGVLLYELLSGQTPFDSKHLIQAGIYELWRVIREDDPPRPSVRIGTLNLSDQTVIAQTRCCDPPRLISRIRGDLDWIVMKCLEKDRIRRYDTATELATDLERHLQNDTVAAAPPSYLYRANKFVRRHVLGVGLACVFGVVCFGFTLAGYQFMASRKASLQELSAVSSIVGQTLTGAVCYGDKETASELLSSLHVEERFVAGAVYDEKGNLFAHYPLQDAKSRFPTMPGKAGYRSEAQYITVFEPIALGGRPLGTLYLKLDMQKDYQRFWLCMWVAALFFAMSAAVGYLISKQAKLRRATHSRPDRL